MEAFPFTIASKGNLRLKLTNEVKKLCDEKFKSLKKETERNA